jgi:hypothetical protein
MLSAELLTLANFAEQTAPDLGHNEEWKERYHTLQMRAYELHIQQFVKSYDSLLQALSEMQISANADYACTEYDYKGNKHIAKVIPTKGNYTLSVALDGIKPHFIRSFDEIADIIEFMFFSLHIRPLIWKTGE